jgi:hypothetical protein
MRGAPQAYSAGVPWMAALESARNEFARQEHEGVSVDAPSPSRICGHQVRLRYRRFHMFLARIDLLSYVFAKFLLFFLLCLTIG